MLVLGRRWPVLSPTASTEDKFRKCTGIATPAVEPVAAAVAVQAVAAVFVPAAAAAAGGGGFVKTLEGFLDNSPSLSSINKGRKHTETAERERECNVRCPQCKEAAEEGTYIVSM
mmetsp:Transcript_18716/g.26347  ORF Transcript_18716/g.26347 Transcript_18716/m.26347 type:complete len:115 (+) Transcript_18716:92-436(+)